MPRYKPIERHSLLLPVELSEQIVPDSYAFALDYLVDHELDLSALDAKFKNDEVGASAYDMREMLKVVLLAYSERIGTVERVLEDDWRQNTVYDADQRAGPAISARSNGKLNRTLAMKPLTSQRTARVLRIGLGGVFGQPR